MTERPGAEGTVAIAVVEGRRERARRTLRFSHGTLAESVDDVDEPDVLLTLTPEEARDARAGELDISVAFMRGTMKMRGDPGLLLQALPVLAADPDVVPAG